MKDEDQSRDDVFAELRRLRSRIAELESGPDGGGHAVGSLEHQYHELIQENRDGYARLNMDGSFVLCNPAFCAMLGYTQEELRGKAYADITPDRWRAADEAGMKQMLAEGSCDRYEKEYLRRDGSIFPVELQSYLVRDADGNAIGMWSFVRDLTERKRFEKTLLLNQERYVTAQTMGHTGNWEYDPPTEHFWASQEAKRIYGFAPDSDAFTTDEVERCIPDRERVHQALVDLLERDKPYDLQYDICTRDKGIPKTIHSIAELARDAEGKPVKITGVIRDITRQKEAERAMAAQYNLLRVAGETVRFGGWSVDVATGRCTWSDAVADIHGMPPGYSPLVEDGIGFYAPEWRERISEVFTRCAEKGTPYDEEMQIINRSGDRVWVRTVGRAVRDEDGSIVKVDGSFQDITDRKLLQNQLVQSQKLEAVGRLAGGVAHGFNSLLMGIMNYVELCRDGIDPEHPIREWLDEITHDAERSAALVHQLLAFARKQTIAPKVMDLNDAVSGTLKLLQPLIGEDVNLLWQPGAGVPPVKMDPAQLDQVLANLCINARDAIEGVGKITIETARAHINDEYCDEHLEAIPGDFVVLSVSDDGSGMDSEKLANIFEPFFTTKSSGEGTGLGLATIYGIVQQNGGFVNVYSEPGQGSTFRIYFPRCEEGAPEEAGSAEEAPRVGGDETVLLVEDEKSVRVTTRMFLQDLGYTVLAAENPQQALQLAEEHNAEVNLVITDVVMPGMNGRELAAKLVEAYPRLRCLFMSGYTANVIAHRGILEEDVHFLSKPFSRDELACKVREVLDG